MSLRDAAAAADLSPSFIGLVEKGETEIAISRLIRLADAYGAVVADLLADVHEPQVEYVPIDDALSVPTNVDGVEILYLASPSWPMEPFLVRLEPGARLTGLRHAAEEFVHCVDGHPTLHVATLAQTMEPGDTISVPSLAEHAYINETEVKAVLVGAVRRTVAAGSEHEPVWGKAVRQGSKKGRS
jgi:transcriptional regulator with XRE-family HTH domain